MNTEVDLPTLPRVGGEEVDLDLELRAAVDYTLMQLFNLRTGQS